MENDSFVPRFFSKTYSGKMVFFLNDTLIICFILTHIQGIRYTMLSIKAPKGMALRGKTGKG